jgi:purine-binding chemotaxis protein CheW
MEEMVTTADQPQEYLIFTVDSVDFGVDIRLVEEIIEVQPVFGIPNALGFCKGIINIRGTIVPVIDMRLKLGFPGTAYDERACIIVIMLGTEPVGMLVDKVQEVVCLSEDELCDPPLGVYKGFTEKIACVGDRINQILSMEAVFGISDAVSV